MNVKIILKSLEINSISNNSGLFYGENKIQSYKGVSHTNEGLGRINGNSNLITKTNNIIKKPSKNT